jgi:hypothetical protein
MPTPATYMSIPLAPVTADSTPEVMPYAINPEAGHVSPPSLGRELAGWDPAVEPDYRQENWFRQNIWPWLARLSCVGAFTMRAGVGVYFDGAFTTGNVLRLSYNGHNNDYVLTGADTGPVPLAANWALQLAQDNTLRTLIDFDGQSVFGGGLLNCCYRVPGQQFPHAITVSVVSGTTTVAVTDLFGGTGTPLYVTTMPGGGSGLPFWHHGVLAHGTMPAPLNDNEACHNVSNTAGASQASRVVGQCDIAGVGTHAIECDAGSGKFVNLPDGSTFMIDVQVCAQRTNGVGSSSWNLKIGAHKTSGVLIVSDIGNLSVLTISATDFYLYRKFAVDDNLAPAMADTTGNRFTILVADAFAGPNLIIIAGCTDAAYNVHFSATARYTIAGVPV